MNSRMFPLAVAVLLALGGCQKTASESASDVAETTQDAQQDVADARGEAAAVVAEANADVADAKKDEADAQQAAGAALTDAETTALKQKAEARYELAKTLAQSSFDIAREKCLTREGKDKAACIDRAEAIRASSEADAASLRSTAISQAEEYK